jgi:hypothetical protein
VISSGKTALRPPGLKELECLAGSRTQARSQVAADATPFTADNMITIIANPKDVSSTANSPRGKCWIALWINGQC